LVSDLGLGRLPKGRHSLTRQEVADAQRLRLAIGKADAMREKGYVGTPVAEILKRAGVSRETFYQLYEDKLACFLDALDLIGAVLIGQLATAFDVTEDKISSRHVSAPDAPCQRRAGSSLSRNCLIFSYCGFGCTW